MSVDASENNHRDEIEMKQNALGAMFVSRTLVPIIRWRLAIVTTPRRARHAKCQMSLAIKDEEKEFSTRR